MRIRSARASAVGVAVVLVVGMSVSLSADRVRLRSGKIVEGMFIGGDSKSVRVLLDDGRCPRSRSRRRSPWSSRRGSPSRRTCACACS